MSKLFIYFLICVSCILLTNYDTFLYGIIFILFALINLFNRYKLDKKTIIIVIILITFCFTKYFISKISLFETNKYFGIVLDKKDNYFVFFNGLKKFYVSYKGSTIDELDLIILTGKQENFYFSTLESGFDFNKYLINKGIFKSLNLENVDVIFDFPIQFYSFKESILSKFDTLEQKALVGGILFSEFDYNNDFANQVKILNLFSLFSVSGVYLNFFLYTFVKLFELKFTKKVSEILSLILFTPFLIINITRFTTIRVVAFYVFRMINKYNFNNYFSKNERISILGILFIIIDPFIVFSTAFYLSFLISIIISYSNLLFNRCKKIKKRIAFYIVLFFITLPFSLNNTNTINIFNSISGYLLSFLFKFIFIFYLFLLLSFGNISVHANFNCFLIKFIKSINFRYFDINVPKLNQLIILCYFFILIMILYFLEINNTSIFKNIIKFVCIFCCFYILPINNTMTAEVDFLNIGQGDSTLIRYRNKTILVDTGGLKYTDLAINNIIPYLKQNRIYLIDAVFITHKDYDHYGALGNLNKFFKIKRIISENNFTTINIGGLEFENLNIYRNFNYDENYNSLVLNFKIKNNSFLLMGDAPKEIEKKIIKDNKNIKCDYLKVGHHGSNTSTCEEFVKTIKPKEAIISCGYKNFYNHPHKEVIDILNKYNVKIKRTDIEGTIKYKFWC